MIVCKRWFRSDKPADVDAAIRLVKQDCLASDAVRAKWVATLTRAMSYLNGYRGPLYDIANGRKYEFRQLQRALSAHREQ